MQWTDTDGAFPSESDARTEANDISREQKLAAVKEGRKASFKVGPPEMLRIAGAGHRGMIRRNLALMYVLAGLRRNAMLCYIPSYKLGKLIDASDQLWAKDMPVGSHRYKQSWLDDRMSWLDEKGKPKEPDWDKLDKVKELTDQAEADYCSKLVEHQQDYKIIAGGAEITVPVVSIDCDEQDLITESGVFKMVNPKMRRVLKAAEIADKDSNEKNARKRKSYMLEVQESLRGLSKEWQDWLKLSQVKQCRAEILKGIIPGIAGAKGAKKKLIKGKLKKVLVHIWLYSSLYIYAYV